MQLIQITRYKKDFNEICTSCGQCCKNLHELKNNIKTISDKYNIPKSKLKFPYKIDSTGRCEKLIGDNICDVYDNRPLICQVDEIRKLLNKTKNEFYPKLIKGCNTMITNANLGEDYIIKE